jgi:hypothetical protein
MGTRRSLTVASLILVALFGSGITPSAQSETLEDVKRSRVMDDVIKQTQRDQKSRAVIKSSSGNINHYTNGLDPRAEFTKLWESSRGPNLLFSWIGANMPRYKLQVSQIDRSTEDVFASARIIGQAGQFVSMEILVPHPNFYIMVDSRTLAQFKKYEPPVLQVVAEEEVEFNGIPAMYYRSDKGRCSLLFKIEKKALVNLSVDRCASSSMMMDVAKTLDFKRLNGKLNS